ncbi:MAG: ATP-binding protein [Candidatus Lambdaproteobacteria bacterium]|nr:ATP-binding protein [Candidatus Lambdaproteobacteria bacterium]
MSVARDMFDMERLPPALDAYLRQTNPWWERRPGPQLPPYRRWAFHTTLRKLELGLAPITVIRGPRQVGKTTLQLQIIEQLVSQQSIPPAHILRVQFDDLPSLRGVQEPILALTRWFENRVLQKSLNEAARDGQPAYLFFDEVQNLRDWSAQLKALVDHNTVKVLVTGSSALRIELGRDSLAGRITSIELGTLLLREVAELRFGSSLQPVLPEDGLQPLLRQDFWQAVQDQGMRNREARDPAFAAFSERGGYPMAQARAEIPWPEVSDQLNETVIRRAIQYDLRMGERGRRRDGQLLEAVFRLASRYAGQSPSRAVYTRELQDALAANIGWQRIRAYLQFLEGTLLLKLVQPLELRLKRRRGNPKLCLCDHGLRASWLQEVVPLHAQGLDDNPHLTDLAGHLAESIVGFYLCGLPHLDVAHLPERDTDPEVDFVLTVGERRIPLEVKYRRRIDLQRDTLGLRAFIEKTVNNAPFGILVTLHDGVVIPDPRIVPVSLPSLLLMR